MAGRMPTPLFRIDNALAALDATASSLLNTRVNLAFTQSYDVWMPLAVPILEWGF